MLSANKHALRLARHARKSCCTPKRAASTAVPQETDIVIVGGGPAGLALASALSSQPIIRNTLKVSLVEASDLDQVRGWTPPPGTFSNRVSSITNASQAFLGEIGAWAHVEDGRTCPMEEIQVWDGLSDARVTFSMHDAFSSHLPGMESQPQMARLTENLNLQRGLLRHLDGTSAVELIDKVKVQSIQREEREGGGWPLVHLSDGRVLRARLLVGADGFNSPVRAYAGIQSYGWAYDTTAVVATMFHNPRTSFQAPNTTAYQRFLPTGPIAFLPLSPTASSLVWSTKPHLAKALLSSEPGVLASMINAAFRLPEVSLRYLHKLILDSANTGSPLSTQQLLEEISWRERSHSIDSRSAYSLAADTTGVPPEDADALPPLVTSIQPSSAASFPLRFNHADEYIGDGAGARTVLVGDAAHTIHPLAGQGLNMGLGDVEALFHCIQKAVHAGGDIGSRTALLPYARERYFENHKTMSACDKLHKLYSFTAEPIVWARSVGVEVLNELDSVKAALMLNAGSQSFRRGPSRTQLGVNVAADAVESLARSMSGVRTLTEGVGNMVGAGVQRVLKGLSDSQRP
ncbi:ubiquinone biosynthesis hydrox [Lentinus tigrinus ALCF2SS1-7]|uniref:Ubiquinone biosynthesis monooxygenase COQ6, mitochondrial n=1 Tax=Lentinus tigrinus ALCF2SS1-6 TaxID=1328759 RepID=A0A5C2S580_9APHY|nr:ubiquinone biosynthesis hydrox [Lentinus tigrinus ALCF2SS1-6]RPD73427.1 ubiquinone biosynthesis hydrox [Lentinus tigrinus ALCF2SS1-7]